MSYSLNSILATLPRTQRGSPIVLGGDPKGKNFLYTNGNSVIIRDIASPEIADIYTEHSVAATVAKYAPSGFYIASGDVSGKIRIWDTTQKEHILKYEYHSLGGQIKDIAWSPDSKRIVAVGEGREKYGNVFLWDTGTTVGEIIGHSKPINSVDFKSSRPFRIATASEDNDSNFYEGPPFKFKHSAKDHSRFVNCIRYSPNGDKYLTGGADGKSFIYDGKTGEKIAELGNGAKPAHAGGIYGLCWSPDNTQVLTVSADKTAKIWDIEKNQVVTEFIMGTTVNDQQVGCLWQGGYLLSVSLSGNINYLDKNNPGTPLRILKGHNKSITAMSAVLSENKSTLYTGSHDGIVNHWSVETGVAETVEGNGHSNQLNELASCCDAIASIGMDDTLKTIDHTSKKFSSSVALDSQPKGVAIGKDGLVLVAEINGLSVYKNDKKLFTKSEKYEPSSVSIHPGQTEIAVGASEDQNVYIYNLEGDTLTEIDKLKCRGSVTQVAYSPDGANLAVGDAGRYVHVFNTTDRKVVHQGWSFHTARVNCLAWSPDSRHIASGSLDTNIIIWSMENPNKRIVIKGAHKMSQITSLAWLNDNTVVSTGQDSCIKQWTLTFH